MIRILEMESDELDKVDGEMLQNWHRGVLFIAHDSKQDENWVVDMSVFLIGIHTNILAS